MHHTFHIPVLGLAFSIDTPLKVARYGISSVVSIVDDELAERMRQYHLQKNNMVYTPIGKAEHDSRARRITCYLNMLQHMVQEQFSNLKDESFEPGTDITRYFQLLPDNNELRQLYQQMLNEADSVKREQVQLKLRDGLKPGAIDVNIMSKVDKLNYNTRGEYLGDDHTDALSALRGFATSSLNSSLIFSAGMNPRLYSYLETFADFYPDVNGNLKKRITLKVSDYRSAYIQAKFLAKKGLWVSEFRIESGLNCGGHAFATDGLLLGPILEEFKTRRDLMLDELLQIYREALAERGIILKTVPKQQLTVQGGIGTAEEDAFLRNHYQVDGTGWGSPFLLVPETTNVDDETLLALTNAQHDDFYLSNASPLGILFNNFKNSSIERQRLERIEKGRPGSPCTKKYLCTNTEFTDLPICTASREYQHQKINQLQGMHLDVAEYQKQFDVITEKICLCEGLCTSAYIKNEMLKPRESKAVAICPGPNLAWFSGPYTLEEMINHIYGRGDLLAGKDRSNMFINELNLYIDYLEKQITNYMKQGNEKMKKPLLKFKDQLLAGVAYYKKLIEGIKQAAACFRNIYEDLAGAEKKLNALILD